MNDIDELKRKITDGRPAELSDEEKLRLLLYYTERETDPEAARRLLGRYGSIRRMFDAEPSALTEGAGLDANTTLLLELISRIRRTSELDDLNRMRLSDPYSAKRYFSAYFGGMRQEVTALVPVTGAFRPLDPLILAKGDASKVHMSARLDPASLAVRKPGRVFLSHCHVNGDPTPSDSDIYSTIRLVKALGMLGIALVDHIITSRGGAVSLRELHSDMFREVPGYVTRDVSSPPDCPSP